MTQWFRTPRSVLTRKAQPGPFDPGCTQELSTSDRSRTLRPRWRRWTRPRCWRYPRRRRRPGRSCSCWCCCSRGRRSRSRTCARWYLVSARDIRRWAATNRYAEVLSEGTRGFILLNASNPHLRGRGRVDVAIDDVEPLVLVRVLIKAHLVMHVRGSPTATI
jgi:hypothetical protein